MDERAFKKTLKRVNERPCAFSKAILRRDYGCARSQRVYISEREVIACKSPGAHTTCTEFLAALREKSLFALHQTHITGPLPHNKEVKIQCGGALGLQKQLFPELAHAAGVVDIYPTLQAGIDQFESLTALPYGEIIKTVVTFQPRKRHSR